MAKRDEVTPDVGTPVDEKVGEQVDLEGGGAILPKLKLDFDEDEQGTIDTIKAVVEQQVTSQFAQAYVILHKLMAKTRIPETDEYGNAITDERGVIVWKHNPDGSIIEDWSRITAEDMDALILNAAVYSYFAGQQSIDDYMQAVFAKYMAEDAFNDKFAAILGGTISDKTTKANRQTRQERYFAFYKAYMYKKGKELIDRLDTVCRRVENVRMMQTKDREREFRANRS